MLWKMPRDFNHPFMPLKHFGERWSLDWISFKVEQAQGPRGSHERRRAGLLAFFGGPDGNEKSRKRPLPGNFSAFAAAAGNQLGSAMWRFTAIGARRHRIHQLLDFPAAGFQHLIQ